VLSRAPERIKSIRVVVERDHYKRSKPDLPRIGKNVLVNHPPLRRGTNMTITWPANSVHGSGGCFITQGLLVLDYYEEFSPWHTTTIMYPISLDKRVQPVDRS
jgi:hypothetical protein